MNCSDVQNRLLYYHSPQWMSDRALRAHIKQCNDCRVFVIEDLRLIGLLRNLPAPRLCEGFADNILQSSWRARQLPHTRSSNRALWIAVAAAVVLTIGLILAYPGFLKEIKSLSELKLVDETMSDPVDPNNRSVEANKSAE